MSAADIPVPPLLQRRRWLAEQSEWIATASRASELGRRARRAYLDRTQLRNLQRVGETSASVATIIDYVKTQVGLHPQWRRENVGVLLLDELDALRRRASEHAGDAGSDSDRHLELCRLYLRQVAAAYLYSIAVDSTARPVAPAPPPRPAESVARAATPGAPRQRPPRPGTARPVGSPRAAGEQREPAPRPEVSAEPESAVAPGTAPESAVVPDAAPGGVLEPSAAVAPANAAPESTAPATGAPANSQETAAPPETAPAPEQETTEAASGGLESERTPLAAADEAQRPAVAAPPSGSAPEQQEHLPRPEQSTPLVSQAATGPDVSGRPAPEAGAAGAVQPETRPDTEVPPAAREEAS